VGTEQQLGATLGIAVFGSVFPHGTHAAASAATASAAGAGNTGAAAAASLTATQHAFWIAIGLTAATAAATTLMYRAAGPRRA